MPRAVDKHPQSRGVGNALWNPLRSGIASWEDPMSALDDTIAAVGADIRGKIEGSVDGVVAFILATTGVDLTDLTNLVDQVVNLIRATTGIDLSAASVFADSLVDNVYAMTGVNIANVPSMVNQIIDFPLDLFSGRPMTNAFNILKQFLPFIDMAVEEFDVTDQALWWINTILSPTGRMALLTGGLLNGSTIPPLDATKIQSGIIDLARLPTALLTTLSTIAAEQISGALDGGAVTFAGTPLGTLLQYLNGSGQFNAGQLHGAFNGGVTLGGVQMSTLLQYLTNTGQFAANQITGPMTNAVTVAGTGIGILLQNFNSAGELAGAAVTGAINMAATVGGVAIGTVAANAGAAIEGVQDVAQAVEDAVTDASSSLGSLGVQVLAGFAGIFGWWMGAINNNAVSSASSAALREALAAQQSHIGKNTSDINDILAALASVADGGANSLDDAVTFTLGTLPAEFTAQSGVGTVSAIYNLADAPTDAMTVSMVFSKPPAPGTHYEIVLRADATFNTCVWMEVGLTDILVKCKAGGITSTLYTLNTSTVIGAEVVSPFFRTGSPYTFSVDDEFNFRMSFFSKGFGAMQTGYWVRTATFTDGGGGGTPTSVKGLLYRKAGYGTDEAALPGSVDGWAIYGPGIEPGSYSTRPATANEGDEFYPNDTGFFSRYIDGEWINIGRVFRRKEPPATGWAWVNQGDASINTDLGAQLLIAPSGLRNWRLRERNKPAGSSWAVEAELEILGNVVPSNPNQWHAGIGIRNPTSGQFFWFGYINNSTGMSLQVGTWANATTFTGNNLTWAAYNALMLDAVPKRLKIRDNGTNLFFEYTHNDINWYALPVLFGTTNSTAFTKVFFGADNEGTGQDEIVRLIHWDE